MKGEQASANPKAKVAKDVPILPENSAEENKPFELPKPVSKTSKKLQMLGELEITETSTISAPRTSQATSMFSQELTEEGLELEKKLDTMSKNLRGNTRTFDFSKAVDPKSTRRAPIVFEPSNNQDNDVEPTLVLPKFGNKKKKEMKFPEPQEPTNLEEKTEPVVEEIKVPDQSTKKKAAKGPKRNLFILSDETASSEQMPSALEKEAEKKDTNEKTESVEEISPNREAESKEKIENEIVNAPPPKKSTKPSFRNKKLGGGLGLDIDTINEEFDIGGERGKRIAQDPIENYIQEISDLARECVQFMSNNFTSI